MTSDNRIDIGAAMAKLVNSGTKMWKKQKKAEIRSSNAYFRRNRMYSRGPNLREAAWQAIPDAYTKASGPNNLPATARQIYYAARAEMMKLTGKDSVDSVYFTQNLLPKYIREHQETASWKVVYDARGNFLIPHETEDESVPLGTISVDNYLSGIHSPYNLDTENIELSLAFPTNGPRDRYGAVLFVEKEGFHQLFEDVQLAKRYDLAIMSTKGQSVVAARKLVDHVCGGTGIPLLILHDFDKEGLLISQSLTTVSDAAMRADRVRYRFANNINAIDLGLRLPDVEEWSLESEPVNFRGDFGWDSVATKEEQEYLQGGQRVELNAFTSEDFITWIEGKLDEHGIKKVIPDDDTLDAAYRRAVERIQINKVIKGAVEGAREEAKNVEVPDDLRSAIDDALAEDPTLPWDIAISRIVEESQ